MDGACFSGDEIVYVFQCGSGDSLWQTLLQGQWWRMPFSSHLTVLIPKSVKRLGLVNKRLIQAASIGTPSTLTRFVFHLLQNCYQVFFLKFPILHQNLNLMVLFVAACWMQRFPRKLLSLHHDGFCDIYNGIDVCLHTFKNCPVGTMWIDFELLDFLMDGACISGDDLCMSFSADLI